MAVGALDAFVRLYDTRILTLKCTSRDVSHQADPSCLAHFSPGHISSPQMKRTRRAFNNLATTFVTFSPDGRELLVNLSGEHIYLYDTTNFQEALKYTFEKTDPDSIPELQSSSKPPIPSNSHSHSTSESVHRLLTMPLCESRQTSQTGQAQSSPSEEVLMLKEEGDVLYKEGKLSAAIEKYSSAIMLCPTWHVTYSCRALALNSRKW